MNARAVSLANSFLPRSSRGGYTRNPSAIASALSVESNESSRAAPESFAEARIAVSSVPIVARCQYLAKSANASCLTKSQFMGSLDGQDLGIRSRAPPANWCRRSSSPGFPYFIGRIPEFSARPAKVRVPIGNRLAERLLDQAIDPRFDSPGFLRIRIWDASTDVNVQSYDP